MAVSRRRWRAAMAALGTVEQASKLQRPWRWSAFHVTGDIAVRRGTDVQSLPRGLRRPARAALDAATVVRARVAGSLVRLGKFDVEEEVRLRAFYTADDEPASALRVQGHVDVKQPGVLREVRHRRQVAKFAPRLAPELLEHGVVDDGRLGYLRERSVRGRPPKNRGEVEELCGPIAAGLRGLHEGTGVDARRLSEVVVDTFADDWRRFVASGIISDRLARRLDDLIAEDRRLEVSIGHGDLVASNILTFGPGPPRTRFVLVDWEHARRAPIAFDLAKLHLNARDPAAARAVLRDVLDGSVGGSADSYGLEEQLALAEVQMLSWHEERVARATAAGRLDKLEKDTRRRVALLEDLVL